MTAFRHYWGLALAAGLCLLAGPLAAEGPADARDNSAAPQQAAVPRVPPRLMVTVGKSLIVDSPLNIQRLSVANGDLIEAVAVGPKEVLINGKGPGETSLVVWQQGGSRLLYDLVVRVSPVKLEAVRQQIARDFPDDDINVTFDNDTVFVRGTVPDVISADRIMAIAETLGKSVNLLHVKVPAVEPQVLLKVRFADVDRSASLALGVNLSSGAGNQNTAAGTGAPISTDGNKTITLSQAVNVFLFRTDINLLAAIQALQAKNMLEMLAEPNVLAISGKPASFLAGGEFPFPMVQPGQGTAAISISWREYGIRLGFLPVVTPRGTIRIEVAPEVSSLDYTNAVTVMGVTVPALTSRKVKTEVELESGQTFAIAGLLDNEITDSFSKVPGIGDIPILGKLFQTKQTSRKNTELLVIITPEVVRPVPAGQKTPDVGFTSPYILNRKPAPTQPGMDKTGPVAVHPPAETVPVEQLEQDRIRGQASPAPTTPAFQIIPLMPVAPAAAPSPSASTSGGSRP
jgi:pilus assembly protein CpaC